MATPIKWGSEFLVGSGLGLEVGLAALAGGQFLITGTTTNETTFDNNVGGQRFNADGTKLGAAFQINTGITGRQGEPVLATLSNGYVVSTYSTFSPNYDIRVQVLSPTGAKVGSETTANTTTTGTQRFQDVVDLKNGKFLVVWEDDSSGDRMRGQIYNANGTKSGSQINFGGSTADNAPQVTALSGGKIMAVWEMASSLADGSGIGIVAQVFNASGTPQGGNFLVNTYASGDQAFPAIATLTNGHVIVAWASTNPTSTPGRDPDTGIYAQILDAAGNKVGGEFGVNTAATGTQWMPKVVALRDGRFIVSWINDNNTASNTISAQLFNANGTKSGAQFLVTTSATGLLEPSTQQMYDVVELADGRVLFSWTFSSTTTSGLRAQIFDPREAGVSLSGTTGADTLVGTRFNDVLSGGAGVDKLLGGLGNDTYVLASDTSDIIVDTGGSDTLSSTMSRTLSAGSVFDNILLTGSGAANATGNSGNNQLTGNSASNVLDGMSGNDTLDPGSAGSDALRGGTGNDTYVLGSRLTGITIVDTGGIDTITSLVSRNLAAYPAIERLTLLGSANAAATGNSLANLITGNAGNNSLSGGAASDTLRGAGGNDTYVLGADADTVQDTAGTDTITSTITRSLASYTAIENLTLLGTANINATGNASANYLAGNGGNNVIEGAGGTDTLSGGSGNDRYVYRSSSSGSGEKIIDSSGIDTIALLGDSTFDFRTFAITGIDALQFGGAATAIFKLAAVPSATLQVTGASDIQTLSFAPTVIANTGATTTNLSGLTFTSWGTEDIVKIDGTFGIDTITGSSRNDVIWGDNGGDILNGGLGADRFVYGNADHTRNATADTITGFSTAQGDRIDLRPWAASAGLPFVITGNNGTDPFTFLGSEVRWEHIGADVHIFITEDGADIATIKLAGLSTVNLGTALIL